MNFWQVINEWDRGGFWPFLLYCVIFNYRPRSIESNRQKCVGLWVNVSYNQDCFCISLICCLRGKCFLRLWKALPCLEGFSCLWLPSLKPQLLRKASVITALGILISPLKLQFIVWSSAFKMLIYQDYQRDCRREHERHGKSSQFSRIK